jgi:hypothetical protein
MSVFSMLKRGRQAAKEHAAKEAERKKKEAEKLPYKHVPRHAASDALAGGPATWREVDRPRIMEQNRRRSMLTASGVNMSGTATPVHVGFPRVNSALSHVSYPAAYASPVVHMPRAYSYTSVQQPGWSSYGGEVVYSPMDGGEMSVKGKEVEKVAVVDLDRPSRASSKASMGPYHASKTSPVGSSGNSTSSQDDLEMKAVKHDSSGPGGSPARSTANPVSQSRPTGEADYFHRLHPSKARRISDPPIPNHYPGPTRSTYLSPKQGTPRVTSLPATAPGIPPVPALPPMHFGSPLAPASNAPPSFSPAPSPRGSGSRHTSSRGSPPRLPIPEEVAGAVLSNEDDSYFSYLPEVGVAVSTPSAGPVKRKGSKSARFAEPESVSSDVVDYTPRIQPDTVYAPSAAPFKPEGGQHTVTTIHALPTMFDEASLPQQPVMPSPQKRGKLSKTHTSEPKPAKRSRWSLRTSRSTAVAG